MQTSYYSKYSGEHAVSIAGRCPEWYKGREYKKLAPKYWFFKKYKDGEIHSEEYTKHYYEEVLNKLNAKEVYEELGSQAILLCWERPNVFCHRKIVADWFEKELGVKVKELLILGE